MTTLWKRWTVLALVCGAPLTALAQAPQAQPEQQQRSPDRIRVRDGDGRDLREPGGPGPGLGMPGPSGGPGGGGGAGGGPGMMDPRPGPFEAPTAEEWDRCEAFSKEYGPKRWAILQTLDEERQQYIRGMVFWRFRNLERLKNSDPDMYQIHLKRFGIDDEIFGIRFPIRQELRAPTQEEMSKLKDKATAWIDVGLEERELRVQRLREMLKREEDYLASEKNGRDAAIAERLAFIEQGRGMGLGMRRREGEGGGFAPVLPPPQRPQSQQQQPATQPSAQPAAP
jgi:hypothetical protein